MHGTSAYFLLNFYVMSIGTFSLELKSLQYTQREGVLDKTNDKKQESAHKTWVSRQDGLFFDQNSMRRQRFSPYQGMCDDFTNFGAPRLNSYIAVCMRACRSGTKTRNLRVK
jgi:hypothetical protein